MANVTRCPRYEQNPLGASTAGAAGAGGGRSRARSPHRPDGPARGAAPRADGAMCVEGPALVRCRGSGSEDVAGREAGGAVLEGARVLVPEPGDAVEARAGARDRKGGVRRGETRAVRSTRAFLRRAEGAARPAGTIAAAVATAAKVTQRFLDRSKQTGASPPAEEGETPLDIALRCCRAAARNGATAGCREGTAARIVEEPGVPFPGPSPPATRLMDPPRAVRADD